MQFPRRCAFLVVLVFALAKLAAKGASDSEIDRLLKKLPPPEKLVKADDRVLRVTDPAVRDPLVKQIFAAGNAQKTRRALELSQQLTTRYPNSTAAHAFRGMFFYDLARYREAVGAFRKSIALQENFVLGHYCLGMSEWQLHNYNAALGHMRKVTRLEPRAAGGWAALSMCAELCGAWQESVVAARHLVALDPRQTAAWVRLAVAERNAGNYDAAITAMNRAVATQGGAKKSTAAKKTAPKKKKP